MTARGVKIREGGNVRFRYVNWHGNEHVYEIVVEGVEFGAYDEKGNSPRDRAEWRWVLHGRVIMRDDSSRPEMGPTRRRTFILDKIKDLEEN